MSPYRALAFAVLPVVLAQAQARRSSTMATMVHSFDRSDGHGGALKGA